MPNGLVFKCHFYTGTPNHLNTGQMNSILSYVLVHFSNGRTSTFKATILILYQEYSIIDGGTLSSNS